MSEEKRKILEMIESGTISAEEGFKLLEALDENEYDEFINENMFEKQENGEEKKNNTENNKYEKKQGNYTNSKAKKNFEKGFDKFSEKFDKWDNKFSERFSFLGEEISKKTQVFSEKVLDKVEQILDGNPFENFWGTPEKQMTTKSFEIPLGKIENIDFHAINGKVIIQEELNDSIKLEVKYALKNSNETLVNEPFSYSINENTLTFNPTMRDNISLTLYAWLPSAKHYKKVNVNSKNGRIEIKDLNAELLNCNTKNAGIKIGNSTLKKIHCNTKNGKIIVDDTKAEEIHLTTANSSITLNDINSQKIETFSQNGQILLKDVVCANVNGKTTNAAVKLTDCKCVSIDYETSNGKIILSDLSTIGLKKLNLHTSNAEINTKFSNNNKYFHISAFTTQSEINLNLPDIEFIESNKTLQGNKKVIGKNYTDTVAEDTIISITASTSNGAINIQ